MYTIYLAAVSPLIIRFGGTPGCYLTSGVVSKTDIVLWQYTAGVVQSWFYDPATGFYLRCLKLDFAPCCL